MTCSTDDMASASSGRRTARMHTARMSWIELVELLLELPDLLGHVGIAEVHARRRRGRPSARTCSWRPRAWSAGFGVDRPSPAVSPGGRPGCRGHRVAPELSLSAMTRATGDDSDRCRPCSLARRPAGRRASPRAAPPDGTWQHPAPGATAPPRRPDVTTTTGAGFNTLVRRASCSPSTSPAFDTERADPGTEYTCDDVGNAPPFAWANVPAGTVELVLVITDPEANGFIHWMCRRHRSRPPPGSGRGSRRPARSS